MKKNQNQLVLLLMVITATWWACKKDEKPEPIPVINYQPAGIINAWLDYQKQKENSNDNRVVVINTIQQNLDFAGAWEEQLNEKEKLLIVPVKPGFVSKNNNSRRSEQYLLLFKNDTGIRRGNIVQYTAGALKSKLRNQNTMAGIFTSNIRKADGIFSILSITDEQVFELNYEQGALRSYSSFKTKKPAGGSESGRATGCWDVYWVTFTSDGGQRWDYMYSYCDDQCQTTKFANGKAFRISCGGGGGGQNDCCLPDGDMTPFTMSISNTVSDMCGIESIDPSTGLLSKTCSHDWSFAESSLLFYRWHYRSVEEARLEKVSGAWQFKSVSHASINQGGTTPPCVSFTCRIVSSIPSISADRRTAGMVLQYATTYTISCLPGGSHSTFGSGGATHFWTAQ